jgi:hypothetical protein
MKQHEKKKMYLEAQNQIKIENFHQPHHVWIEILYFPILAATTKFYF